MCEEAGGTMPLEPSCVSKVALKMPGNSRCVDNGIVQLLQRATQFVPKDDEGTGSLPRGTHLPPELTSLFGQLSDGDARVLLLNAIPACIEPTEGQETFPLNERQHEVHGEDCEIYEETKNEEEGLSEVAQRVAFLSRPKKQTFLERLLCLARSLCIWRTAVSRGKLFEKNK
ncbi:unnamed protein product [Darwinula stevensoni]|uniref:Uncharacterized protein n=1 Tax=Darwinula stevensoni TaxID=69355 RepID=A0A7R9AC52_9CRUS|nr:unnamed protein product [Darwinula stevensoni]CAG0899998.1 unnamed protein product [Darwinula stevensoni]